MTYEHKLSNGKIVLLDDSDWEITKQYYLGYSGIDGDDVVCIDANGNRTKLGRMLLNPPAELFVDHIDRNPLNNQRSNLRIASRRDNNRNRGNWGQYPKGITYDPYKVLYRARIQVDGKRIGLGRYKKLEDAVAAYNKAAEEHFGAFMVRSEIEEEHKKCA